MMKTAMAIAKSLGKIIVAHCEDNSLLNGGYIHDGEYARLHGHKGISSASEYAQVMRDVELLRETKCKYHVCHVSTKESISLIRDAKASGVDITCETAPHYLTFSTNDVRDDGRFRMNPPIRSLADKIAMIEALCDGTVDMIATDHAPHSAEEKSRGLASLNGIVGLEVAFPVLYTELVKTHVITLERLVELMSYAPSNRFGIDVQGFTVFDLNSEYKINVNNFASMGKCTPYENKSVFGKCIANVIGDKVVYLDKVSLC
jgi:dihydroorotase